MKIAHIFLNVDMRNSHDGLNLILKKKVKELKEEECAIFVNRRWTHLKMLLPQSHVVLHLKQPTSRPIEPSAIKYLPKCVNGSELDYGKALETSMRKDFKKKFPRRDL